MTGTGTTKAQAPNACRSNTTLGLPVAARRPTPRPSATRRPRLLAVTRPGRPGQPGQPGQPGLPVATPMARRSAWVPPNAPSRTRSGPPRRVERWSRFRHVSTAPRATRSRSAVPRPRASHPRRRQRLRPPGSRHPPANLRGPPTCRALRNVHRSAFRLRRRTHLRQPARWPRAVPPRPRARSRRPLGRRLSAWLPPLAPPRPSAWLPPLALPRLSAWLPPPDRRRPIALGHRAAEPTPRPWGRGASQPRRSASNRRASVVVKMPRTSPPSTTTTAP